MNVEDNKCAHDMCTCRTTGDEEYCSDRCKDADDQDLTEISCGCGHSGCGAAMSA